MKHKFTVLFLLLFIFNTSKSQVITTVVGNGSAGYSGDGLLATATSFSGCTGFAIDKLNNIYIADYYNNRIRRVDALTGIITTIAGNGTAGYSGDGGMADTALINSPVRIAIDKIGNIYFSDYGNLRVRKIDTFGTISTIAGNGMAGASGDYGPATNASFSCPNGLAINDSNNLFVCDNVANKIREINLNTGIITTAVGTGAVGASGDGSPATSAEINRACDLTFDRQGNMYIADYANFKVRMVAHSSDIISTVAGNGAWAYTGDDVEATSTATYPSSVAIDNFGNLFISDYGNYRIRKVDSSSAIISTFVGTGVSGYFGDGSVATSAEIKLPQHICFDNCGNLYISDPGNYRIRKVTIPQTPPTITITASDDSFCAGNSVILLSSYSASVPGTAAYQWIVNGSVVSGATNSSYNYNPASGDSVRCVLTFSSNCGGAIVSSNMVNMTLVSSITPTIALPTGIVYASAGTVVTVNAALTDTPISYLIYWFNKGVWFATTTTSWVTYTKTMAIDSISAHIAPSGFCYDSAVSGVEVVIDSVLGVQGIGIGTGVRVYPNPAHDVLELETSSNCCHWQIMDLPGRALLQGQIKGNRTEINIERLPAGVYVIRIDGIVAGRFVKLSEP